MGLLEGISWDSYRVLYRATMTVLNLNGLLFLHLCVPDSRALSVETMYV
jgi:hypothetical protein